MALVMPPVQAAAIMLPILIIMDVASLWSWRGYRDMTTLKLMLPGGLLGVGIGWLTASIVTDDMVKLIVGLVAIIFFARYIFASAAKRATSQSHNGASATLWSTIAGFTSFVAHAGGPPTRFIPFHCGRIRRFITAPVLFSLPLSMRSRSFPTLLLDNLTRRI